MAQTAGGTYYAASSELVSSWPATSLDLANQLETRFAAKWTSNTAWTSYTPSLVQPTGIAIKDVTAKYLVIGNLVHAYIYLRGNGTGTAGNKVAISLPVNCQGPSLRLGVGSIYDSSAVVPYSAVAFADSATAFCFIGDWSGSQFWGQSPNLAVGTDDQFTAVLTYEKG